jgi:hypothetical protein
MASIIYWTGYFLYGFNVYFCGDVLQRKMGRYSGGVPAGLPHPPPQHTALLAHFSVAEGVGPLIRIVLRMDGRMDAIKAAEHDCKAVRCGWPSKTRSRLVVLNSRDGIFLLRCS